jgi:hypothetical protein
VNIFVFSKNYFLAEFIVGGVKKSILGCGEGGD